MIGHRSIGETEFYFLLQSENPLYGRFKYSQLDECSCTLPYGVVAFFLDEYRWHDAKHFIDIKVVLPDDAQTGIGIYKAAESLGETKVWTGKRGNTEYRLREAYVRFYEPKDILEIDLRGRYAGHFVKGSVKEFCEKYQITLIWEGNIVFEGDKTLLNNNIF